MINKKSGLEAVSDTLIGLCVNFPLGFLVLVVCSYFTTNLLIISATQTVVLTCTAILRRYLTREFFRIKINAK
jgi:hypothetical protein